MIPIVTPAEMAAIDAAAPEPVDVLIERAGAAVARAALRLLGGGYGRRVVVVAGGGNNGADGRAAARRLARRGVRCAVVGPWDALPRREADLVIDAAFGTGFVDRGGWRPADVGGTPVLAVDIPSGVSGLTGEAVPGAAGAVLTVTFAALKPGLVLHPGRALAGEVEVADIGLDCRGARAWAVAPEDVASWVPARAVAAHKWQSACWVVAGSAGMTGAAHLAARAASRAGAGYVRLSSPGTAPSPAAPTEAVTVPLPAEGWAGEVAAGCGRFGSLVVGPGLGRAEPTAGEISELLSRVQLPVVLDGDALAVLGSDVDGLASAPDGPSVVLTPHDGELAALTGRPARPDRFDDARELAARTGAVVLLKGATTVVAAPDGDVLVSLAGDARLATAGTGDVLSGIIGALLACGVPPLRAAAGAAVVHGLAALLGPARGLVAGDVVEALPAAWERLHGL